MGSVAPGKHADLVLLKANPVESAGHLHRIGGVVRGGVISARRTWTRSRRRSPQPGRDGDLLLETR
jgi:cytosine/adenosine deaminase-related metal-dependent hydrolase